MVHEQLWHYSIVLLFCFFNVMHLYPLETIDTSLQPLDSSTLKTVNMIYRHGARTPISVLQPSEHYTIFDEIVWPEPPGILTKTGKKKLYELGEVLRVRYDGFLSPYYVPEEINVSATDAQRTQVSTKALLAGLYNLFSFDQWDETIISSIPITTDYHLIDKSNVPNSEVCPLFKLEQKMAIKNLILKNSNQHKDIYNYLSNIVGRNINGMFGMFGVWDVLECLKHNELELPDWTVKVYPEPMSDIEAKVLKSMLVGTPNMVKFMAGPHLQEIHNQFDKSVKNEQPVEKIIMHGGHDFSVTSLLAGLGTFEQLVNPGDAIILELHEIPQKGMFVQFLYAEAGGTKVHVRRIKNCENPCPLELFIKLTKDSIPKDWSKECISYNK